MAYTHIDYYFSRQGRQDVFVLGNLSLYFEVFRFPVLIYDCLSQSTSLFINLCVVSLMSVRRGIPHSFQQLTPSCSLQDT